MFSEWQAKRLLGIRAFKSKFYPSAHPADDMLTAIIHGYLKPSYRVLNVGCGTDASLGLRGKCKEVVGVDLSESGFHNADVDTSVVDDAEKLDLPPEFDLIVCKDLIEHLANPIACFHGFHRALKDGGLAIIRTPNLLNYGQIVTKLTPHSFHEWFLDKILKDDHEVAFPVYYRANRRRKLCAMMREAGFKTIEVRMTERCPDYLSFSYTTLLVGIAYERIVSRFNFLDQLRFWITGVFQIEKGS